MGWVIVYKDRPRQRVRINGKLTLWFERPEEAAKYIDRRSPNDIWRIKEV